jgi:hypothetical protein
MRAASSRVGPARAPAAMLGDGPSCPATRRLGGQWLGAPVSGLDDLATFPLEDPGSV